LRWTLLIQMHLDPQYTEGSIMSLAGVKFAPVLNFDLAPLGILELRVLLWLCPGIRFLEGEALAVDVRPAPTVVGWRFAIEYTVTAEPHQQSTRLVTQGAQEAMVAIAAVAYDEIEAVSQLTKLLDLGYAYFHCVSGAADTFNIHRQCPTTSALSYPGQHRVGMAHHRGRASDGRSRAMYILAVWQGRRTRSGPCSGVQSEDLSAWYLIAQISPEPVGVLTTIFDGSVGARPLATEDRAETEFGERAYRT
jgi:hypothetical protein